MSNVNEEILITFDELLQLKNEDISACIDISNAIDICEKSSAPPNKIYNLWVQKLLSAYNLKAVSSKNWGKLLEHFGNLFREFVKTLNISTDTSYLEAEQWWLDSQELLKRVKTIIQHLDIITICSIINFALEISLGTFKYAKNRNFSIVCELLQLIFDLTKSIYAMPLEDYNKLQVFRKIISSFCDLGSMISFPGVKIYIDLWRTVAKLTEQLQTIISKTENSVNVDMSWNEKAILGIFKELKKILQFYNKNPCSSNDNLLHVAQFYLRLLRLFVNFSIETVNRFPAIKEFMEIYTFCHHDLTNKENPKLEVLIKNPLFDIFLLVHRDNAMTEILLRHLKYSADNAKSSKFVFDYLKVSVKSCSTDNINNKPDVQLLLTVYNYLVEGPLIFVDDDKYIKILEYFMSFTILDTTNAMHKKLCEYVMDTSWIRAYTSMEILNIYYSYMLGQRKSNINLKCLEFWLPMWNKLNKSTKIYRQNKKLIEILLKTILNNTQTASLQQCTNKKYENIEIILLMCDKPTEQSLQYLHTSLVKNLKQIQDRSINGLLYNELRNLLDICSLKPQFINDFLKENLLNTLTGLLTTLPAVEMKKCRDFVNKCFRFFSLQQNQQQREKLLKYLIDHEQQCCNMVQSVFLFEFLLKQRPQSTKLLEKLKTVNKLAASITNLIDCRPLNNQLLDLKLLKTFLQSSNHNCDSEQVKKRPCVDKGNFSSIKSILNDLNVNSQKLLNFPHSSFDADDLELMRTIKNSIEKCFTY